MMEIRPSFQLMCPAGREESWKHFGGYFLIQLFFIKIIIKFDVLNGVNVKFKHRAL